MPKAAPDTKAQAAPKKGATSRGGGPRAAPTATATPASRIEDLSGDPNFMTSLARGLAVIRAFSHQKRRQTASQLSQKTGIPRAAVRRCLYTLERLGYVVADDERSFSLRPSILTLGYAYLSSTPLATVAQPLLDRVTGALHESCSIAVLEGDEIVYVARSKTTRRIMSVDLGVGSRLPAYCTSLGRVLLAALPARELNSYLSRLEIARLTSRTVSSAGALRRVLEGVRDQGYAIVDQELEIGLRSIAVPVQDTAGRIVAAMNIGTQVSRVSVADLENRFLPVLQEAAFDLGQLLLP